MSMHRVLGALAGAVLLVGLGWGCNGSNGGSGGSGTGGSGAGGVGGSGGAGGSGLCVEDPECASCKGPSACPATLPTVGAACSPGDEVCDPWECPYAHTSGGVSGQILATCVDLRWEIAAGPELDAVCAAYTAVLDCKADLACRWVNYAAGCHAFRSCIPGEATCTCSGFDGAGPGEGTCLD